MYSHEQRESWGRFGPRKKCFFLFHFFLFGRVNEYTWVSKYTCSSKRLPLTMSYNEFLKNWQLSLSQIYFFAYYLHVKKIMINYCLILIGLSVVALVYIALQQQSVVGNETRYQFISNNIHLLNMYLRLFMYHWNTILIFKIKNVWF